MQLLHAVQGRRRLLATDPFVTAIYNAATALDVILVPIQVGM